MLPSSAIDDLGVTPGEFSKRVCLFVREIGKDGTTTVDTDSDPIL